MKERGEIAAPRDNAPEVELPDGFWDDAKPVPKQTKQAVSMRVDPDVLAFFKRQGDGHLTRMHAVLRAYVDAHEKSRRRSS
ncbi:MAG: BrnA antitoxin family protein [Pseudomonadota bacterium]